MEENKYDCSCTLTSNNTINLKNLSPILGLSTNKMVSTNTPTKSDELDINHGLHRIKVYCNLIDRSNSIFNG